MSKADEYVEKVVAESYKRELDQEENVVRSLPFFATSLGILATALGLARTGIGPFSWSGIQLAIYVTLAVTGVSVMAVLAFLVEAIRPRDFKNPMTEQDLISYRSNLEAYYAAFDKDAATLEAAVTDDLRQAFSRQIAEAARIVRANNLQRLQARSRGLMALIVAIFLAFVLLGLILARDGF